MKITEYLIIGLTLVNIKAYSQKNIKIFYDRDWKISLEENASFIRHANWDTTIKNFVGNFEDYSIKGQLITSGSYENGKKVGDFKIYYQNGEKLAEGGFKNDIIKGIWIYYYSNGNLMQKIEFLDDDFKIMEYYDSSGKNLIPFGTGNWQMNYKINTDEADLEIKGNLLDSLKHGKWVVVDKHSVAITETYKKGKLIKSKYFDGFVKQKADKKLIINELFIPYNLLKTNEFQFNEGVSTEEYPFFDFLPKWEEIKAVGVINGENVYNIDIFPRYLGGQYALRRMIQQNLTYPKAAIHKKAFGTVHVEVTIDKKGVPVDYNVSKSIEESLNNEAIRVTKLIKKWKPGIYHGEPIMTIVTIPITFSIPVFINLN